MEHLLLKAAISAVTDEGTFTAVISAASIDREKDVVDPAGMVRALQKWTATGKKIPLAWQHSGAAEDQIGYIDPATAKAVGGEVLASGWIDQSTPVGADAWRQVKMGTLGFSFGYLTLDSSPRKGGGAYLKELDVFEVTATPTPMNNDTRVVGWKADMASDQVLSMMLALAQRFIDSEDDQDDIAVMQAVTDQLRALGAVEMAEPDDSAMDKSVTPEELKARAEAVELEFASGGLSREQRKAIPDPEPVAPEAEFEQAIDALGRIPQSDLSQDVKDALTAKAIDILGAQKKSVDVTDQGPSRARSVDLLRAKADAVELEFASDGLSRTKSPPPAKQAPPPDLIPLGDLKRRMRDEMLTALSGGIET